ncbi:MAG: hypothetical protein LBS00_09875 [Synergistaceae bacterium]|nr:hypothetical protein [Synergistaceae bacterium]
MNSRYRRIVTGVVLFCLCAASWAGDVFIFSHADHDHTGESCPVCAHMKSASDSIRRLLEGLVKSAGSIQAILSLSVAMFLVRFFGGIKHQTLITAKVRLND